MIYFSERHRAPSGMVMLGVVVAVVSAAGLAVSLPSLPARTAADASLVVAVLGSGIALGITAAAQTLSITVCDQELTVRLTPFFRRRIHASHVVAVAASTISASRYGGFGVRRAPGRAPAVFQRGGVAARLAMRDGSELLVECDDVGALAAALERARES